MKKSKRSSLVLRIILISISILSQKCTQEFEIIKDLKYTEYQLLDIDSNSATFPKLLNGKVGIVGYIFTNCPDICPLTTNNMRLIQEKLKSQSIKGSHFVSISFDPLVDKPTVLKKFAEIRDLDLSNWDFLTGDEATIKKLMKKVVSLVFWFY